MNEKAIEDAQEGVDLLDQLIENIRQDVGYSDEITLNFLSQINEAAPGLLPAPDKPVIQDELHLLVPNWLSDQKHLQTLYAIVPVGALSQENEPATGAGD